MKKDEEVLKKLQSLELNIALEVKRICEKHKIRYFLIAGTLLGAVRHKGFIPWDDDMDIGMLREDYNKFIYICKKELSNKYFLQTWETDSEYPFSYAKLRLNGTEITEKFSKKSKAHKGIFVDIFPFDNVPSNKIQRMIQSKKIFIYKRLLWIYKEYGYDIKDTSLYNLKFFIAKKIAHCFKFEKLKSNMEKALIKYNSTISESIFTDGSYGYDKETIKREWINKLIKIEFENESFTSIANYDEYLTYFYGDYMTPPPASKRTAHELLDVNFGEY